MSAKTVIQYIETKEINNKEDLSAFFTFFQDNFSKTNVRYKDAEAKSIVEALLLKLKKDFTLLTLSPHHFHFIYSHITSMMATLEKDYKRKSWAESFLDEFIGFKVTVYNVTSQPTSPQTYIKWTAAQLITFLFSSTGKKINQIDIRQVDNVYKKCALHPTIAQDIEFTSRGITKTMPVEDWFIASSAVAPGFFSVISSNPKNTAVHLLSFIGSECPAPAIIDYLEYLKIPAQIIADAASAKIKYAKKISKNNKFMTLDDFSEDMVFLEKYILSTAVAPTLEATHTNKI